MRIRECHDFSEGETQADGHEWNTFMDKSYGKPRSDVNALPGMAGFVDVDGHGTHCAGIVLQTAPKANLYIAKVGSGRNEAPTTSRAIAKVSLITR